MQSGKEILSVNKTLSKKYLSSNHAENKVGRLIPEQFLFSKKDLCQVKTSDQHLSLIYFGRARVAHAIKTNFITFQTVDLEICSILIFIKGSATSFSATFCV